MFMKYENCAIMNQGCENNCNWFLFFYNGINLDIGVKNGNIVVFSVRGGGQIWQG